jgi:methylphosphotriester-DNA--protein-cysteine methyltransferase
MTIRIYKKEISDGIGDLVKGTASVAYCSEATIRKGDLKAASETISDPDILSKILAENKDQVDLYYLESVLVSTGWNKNDDVFMAEATWEARNTPEDKQFNFMHDENDIIGHITGSYVLTKDGKAVADDDKARPDEFDIVTQAVLYNSWMGDDNRERMEKIISEIEEGKWYVSMECLFAGFDYALIDPNGNAKILARDEQSSFLTKHLRSYGGTGEYEDYKIGRALSNISFSGKGLVAKPANSRSIILNSKSSASVNFNLNESDPQFSIGDINMSDQTLLEKQLAEIQTQLTEAKSENVAIKAEIEEAKDKEFALQVEAYEATEEKGKATIGELNELIKSTQARVAELEDTLATSQTELAEAVKEVDEMHKKEIASRRTAALIEAGVSEEDVEGSLANFDALEDEAFESIVALMKKKAEMPPWMKKDEDKEDKKDKKDKKDKDVKAEEAETEEEEVTAEIFEEVETTEATLVEADEYDEVDATRASVADWLSKHVLSNK